MLKVCITCSRALDVFSFSTDNSHPSGKARKCRECINAYNRARYQPKPTKRGRHLRVNKRTEEEKREQRRIRNARWLELNREKKQAYEKQRRILKRDEILERGRQYRAANRETIAARKRERKRELRSIDITYRLNEGMSRAIRNELRGRKEGRSWRQLVGYDIETLKRHLERQFSKGMSWDNYGVNGWHIDHIIPLAAFKYECPEDPDFQVAWGLPNLRPLWAKDNIAKGDKILTLL